MQGKKEPIELEYQTIGDVRWSEKKSAVERLFLHLRVPLTIVRQVTFSLGLALLAGGIGFSWHNNQASAAMAVGAFLAGICVPLRRE